MASTFVFILLALSATPPDGGTENPPIVDVPMPVSTESEVPSANAVLQNPNSTVSTLQTSTGATPIADVAKLAALAPGISLQEQGGGGQRQTISLRGASSNAVLVRLDNIPLALVGAAVDFSRLPQLLVEQVDVMRGIGSAQGYGALGGSVDISTLPVIGPELFKMKFRGGSFGTIHWAGAIRGEPNQSHHWLVAQYGSYSRGDFSYRYEPTLTTKLRRNNDAQLLGGLFKYRYDLPSTSRIQTTLHLSHDERGLAGTIDNPDVATRQRSFRVLGNFAFESMNTAGSVWALRAYGRYELAKFTALSNLFPATQHDASLGAEAQYDVIFFHTHAVTGLVTVGAEVVESNISAARPLTAVMLQDDFQFLWAPLHFNVTARLDVAGRYFGVSPKGGARIELPNGFSTHINVGQAFRAPSLFETNIVSGSQLPNPTLKPERAISVDADLSFRKWGFFARVAGFYSIFENLISYEYYFAGASKPFNFAAARIYGVESELHYAYKQYVSASVSYTWQKTQNLKDDPRYYLNPLPFRPEHQVKVSARAGISRFNGSTALFFQTAQFQNRTASIFVPKRVLWSASLSSELLKDPSLVVSFECQNLLNQATPDFDGYPLPGRSFFIYLSIALPKKEHS